MEIDGKPLPLPLDDRHRIANKIVDTLKRNPFSGPEELTKLAAQFEDRIFISALNHDDYMRQISLNSFLWEKECLNSGANAMPAASLPDPGKGLREIEEDKELRMEKRKKKDEKIKKLEEELKELEEVMMKLKKEKEERMKLVEELKKLVKKKEEEVKKRSEELELKWRKLMSVRKISMKRRGGLLRLQHGIERLSLNS